MGNRVGAPDGNSNARKENRLWGEAIRRAVTQADGERLRELAERLIARAAEGDVSALRELGDRLDGKPHQSIDATIDGSLTVEIVNFPEEK